MLIAATLYASDALARIGALTCAGDSRAARAGSATG